MEATITANRANYDKVEAMLDTAFKKAAKNNKCPMCGADLCDGACQGCGLDRVYLTCGEFETFSQENCPVTFYAGGVNKPEFTLGEDCP